MFKGGDMKNIYFFIGTEAELMKMFTTIRELKLRGYRCIIVSSGQNEIHNSLFLELAGCNIDIDLSQYAPEVKSAKNYISWLFNTRKYGVKVMKEQLPAGGREDCLWIVHGDTLSTLLGAQIARKTGIKYMHVESGPRSFSLLSPFPEEIDRYYASKYSVVNFCPQKIYAEYAEKRFKGKAVNTYYNTGIETLNYEIKENRENSHPRIVEEKYFLLAIHRQENLYNKEYMVKLFTKIIELSDKMKCVFIYHEQTKDALVRYNLWDKVNSDKNICIIKRRPYVEFIDLVDKAEFVIADGCGNQQEFYYLGKPYLIMRLKVEKDSEGVGWNAECFGNKFNMIDYFYNNYQKYRKSPVVMEKSPSVIIADSIDDYFAKGGVK